MHLWNGSLSNFVKEGEAGALTGEMLQTFWNHHRYQPSIAETTSWDNSLKALAITVDNTGLGDVGVVLEYHLPYTGCRIDALFFGKNYSDNYYSTIVELKQWSTATLSDNSLNLIVNGAEHVHPSEQAWDYAKHLTEIHSSYSEYHIGTAPCSYCHNLQKTKVTPLDDERFSDLLKISPLFKKGDEEKFISYLTTSIGKGHGIDLMNKFMNGRFKPNKKMMEVLNSVIHDNEKWHLLDNQRLAYNTIWAQVLKIKRGSARQKSAILIRGGPGTGKTVIATQLLADALRNQYTAVHTTGGHAFTTSLRAQFKGADKLFAWNLHFRKVPTEGIDLLLVDEAHRLRKTSDTRFTPASQRNKHSQMEELLSASKVTVFMLDENQYVRPDEIGSSQLIRNATKDLGITLFEYDLHAQFRCGNCYDYLTWIDYLLGYESTRPKYWADQYTFKIVDTPTEIERIIQDAKRFQETGRIVAGFCWHWSNPLPDGALVHDVKIGDWSHPWNEKPSSKKVYKPENHPYTLWANTPAGETQIGCIYSAQGFEFDRMGVIWGEDLVWRKNKWVAQREKSFDSPVKVKTVDTLQLLRNVYRVLLTRGTKETRLLCLDDETREHITDEYKRLQETISLENPDYYSN
ncbi:MAG: DNA/RNA helicase domain-containing protein [Methanoregula sp.]